MATTRITTKNQVTLPVSVLGEAHLRPGAVITVEAEGPGRIVVRAVDDELEAFIGALPGVWPPDALESLRGEWP